VAEQTLVLPLFYIKGVELVKPWVKKQRTNQLGYVYFFRVSIDEH
jgi:hypothetical protein